MQCPMFESCTCKTAMCRSYEPDESCYWYRYFYELIGRKELRKSKETGIVGEFEPVVNRDDVYIIPVKGNKPVVVVAEEPLTAEEFTKKFLEFLEKEIFK